MKTTTLYDFTLTAGGAQIILADANMYKVLTATGDISVTRDGGATIKPLRAGRGERNVAFTRLILRDLSGAPNSGTILVGDSDFIDDTIVLSSAINVRPEVGSNSFSSLTALTAATPDVVFAPASNTKGAIVLSAVFFSNWGGVQVTSLLAKAGTPATVIDGEVLAVTKYSGSFYGSGEVTMPQYIAAGKGLYFVTNGNESAANNLIRACRYKLL